MKQALVTLLCVIFAISAVPAYAGICGDANGDGKVNVVDAVYLITYIFKGGPPPNPLGDGDVNYDTKVNVVDAVYLISYIFKHGPAPYCGGPVPDIIDIDGNVYHQIRIGTQWWLLENLTVTHYRNGDPITNITDRTTWGSLTTEAYCNYNNDTSYVPTYGRLYNWYAVHDSRNIAPVGCHVPSEAEWLTLRSYLGDYTLAGGKLKEIGLTHWMSPNTGATNESGFTALPGSLRTSGGGFNTIGGDAYFWTSTGLDSNTAFFWELQRYTAELKHSIYGANAKYGFSVRCIVD